MFTYKHVIIIGIDGAGHGFQFAKTPCMDKIFAKGATTYGCLTAIPTISAECWGSLLIGVKPEIHELTNDIVCSASYINGPLRNGQLPDATVVHRPKEAELPTVFKLVRNAMPDAKLSAFSNWTPINDGIIEQDIDVVFDCGGDQALTDKICEEIKKNHPTLFFVQYDSVDGVGHTTGYNNEIYYEKLNEIDRYMGQIYDTIVAEGIADDTLFIVTADHGGIDHFHGGTSDEEKYVFFGAAGKTVADKHDLDMFIRDIPAITCKALGVDGNPDWDSKVPDGMFTE